MVHAVLDGNWSALRLYRRGVRRKVYACPTVVLYRRTLSFYALMCRGKDTIPNRVFVRRRYTEVQETQQSETTYVPRPPLPFLDLTVLRIPLDMRDVVGLPYAHRRASECGRRATAQAPGVEHEQPWIGAITHG